MTDLVRADLEQFRNIVASRLGLQYDDGKLDYLAGVVRQRMKSVGSPYFKSYVEHLSSLSGGSDELRALAAQLTVNETFFFRNADNFRALTAVVLPARILARAKEKRLRILSAGCASGEEPYSLAIMVHEALPQLATWDVKITGIDVSAVVLAKAAQARYSAWSLRATSEKTKRLYFRADGADFVLAPAIRKMVTFEERNLIEGDPFFWRALHYDIVFCRNVLMYFAPDKARDVVRRISEALLPDGFFFLGHAETLRGLSQDFHLCHTHETFYYRRHSAPEDAATARREPPIEPSEAELPAESRAASSWVDIIHQSSARIAALVRPPTSAAGQEAPRSIPTKQKTPTPTWDLGLVLEAMKQERFAEALALICSLPPDSLQDIDALLLRVVLLTNNGRFEESEEVCRRLIALDEFNAGAYYLMALCREHAGDSKGAIAHGQTAIYLDAGFAMPHLHLGIMAKRAGDLATARRELEQALLLLADEVVSRLLLFGGGFSRDALQQFCRTELRAVGGKG